MDHLLGSRWNMKSVDEVYKGPAPRSKGEMGARAKDLTDVPRYRSSGDRRCSVVRTILTQTRRRPSRAPERGSRVARMGASP